MLVAIAGFVLWLVTVTVAGLVGAIAGKALTRWRAKRRRTRVLILVEQPFEADAVREAALAHQLLGKQPKRPRDPGVEEVATLSRARLLLARTGSSATLADAAGLYARVRPDYVIFTGVCSGLYPDRQRVGDVVIAVGLLAVVEEHSKTGHSPSTPARLAAGADPDWATPALVSRFCAVVPPAHDPRFQTETGVLLRHGDLAESWTLADDLTAVDQHAVGACSDRDAVYTAAVEQDRRVAGWVMVRGVAWYGRYRTDQHNQTAANNAASLIVEAAACGALDHVWHAGHST